MRTYTKEQAEKLEVSTWAANGHLVRAILKENAYESMLEYQENLSIEDVHQTTCTLALGSSPVDKVMEVSPGEFQIVHRDAHPAL